MRGPVDPGLDMERAEVGTELDVRKGGRVSREEDAALGVAP